MHTTSRSQVQATTALIRRHIDQMDLNGAGQIPPPEAGRIAEALLGRKACDDTFLCDKVRDLFVSTVLPIMGKAAPFEPLFGSSDPTQARARLDQLEADLLELPAFQAGGDQVTWDGTFADANRLLSLTFKLEERLPSLAQELVSSESLISALEVNIAKLEAENAGKARGVHELVAQIEGRQHEVRRQQRRKGGMALIAAAYGAPGAVGASVGGMLRDDARLNELRRALSSAQADQTAVQTRLSEYQAFKSKIQEKVRTLPTTPIPKKIPEGLSKRAAHLLRKSESIGYARTELVRCRAEIFLLEGVRHEAEALGIDFDGILSKLQASCAHAEALVQASMKDTSQLLEALVSKDPNAAGLDLLTGYAKEAFTAALTPSVNRLLKSAPAEVRHQLRPRVLDALFGAVAATP